MNKIPDLVQAKDLRVGDEVDGFGFVDDIEPGDEIVTIKWSNGMIRGYGIYLLFPVISRKDEDDE